MKNRIKKLFAILLTLTVLSGLLILPTGIWSAATEVLWSYNPGDAIAPGTYYVYSPYAGFDMYLLYEYDDSVSWTENMTLTNVCGYNFTTLEDLTTPYEYDGWDLWYKLTIPDVAYQFLLDAYINGDNVFWDASVSYPVPEWIVGEDTDFLYAILPVAEEEPVNENGEDFWKWWRNAARLTREQKTVTLNVPADIDNTVIPTFFFTAIKEANANVTLNINGETYSLNTNNLPAYYPWASEVSVEVLK